jgi:hypothetical protein
MLPELPLPEPMSRLRSIPEEPVPSCPGEPIRPCPCEPEDPGLRPVEPLLLPVVEPMLPVLDLRLRLCSSKSRLPWLEPLPLPTFLLSAIEPSAF